MTTPVNGATPMDDAALARLIDDFEALYERNKARVGDRPREKAGRMTGADLDDPGRAQAPGQAVGRGGIEPWKPVLSPTGRGSPLAVPGAGPGAVLRRGADRREVGGERLNPVQDLEEAGGRGGEPGFRRRIGRPLTCRRDRAGVAIGYEEAARRQAQDGLKSEAQTPECRTPCRPGHGCRTSPSFATMVPGLAASAAAAISSMVASSWEGSW